MRFKHIHPLSAAVFALLSFPVAGLAHETEAGGLPACRSIEGKNVEVAGASEEFLRVQAYTKLALSLTGADGVPVILLDTESLGKLPEQFQNFVFFHECAHHELGHVTLENIIKEQTLRKADLSRELNADCVSVKRLVSDPKFSYTRADIDVIMDTMKQELGGTSVKKDQNGKVIKKGIFKFYMPIEERNALLLQCFEEASRGKISAK